MVEIRTCLETICVFVYKGLATCVCPTWSVRSIEVQYIADSENNCAMTMCHWHELPAKVSHQKCWQLDWCVVMVALTDPYWAFSLTKRTVYTSAPAWDVSAQQGNATGASYVQPGSNGHHRHNPRGTSRALVQRPLHQDTTIWAPVILFDQEKNTVGNNSAYLRICSRWSFENWGGGGVGAGHFW